jgi:antitoxin (DNA-binding transcriptional repressor) of toxin-antitoxin stability system
VIVGTKELKNRLSHYLKQVRQGEVVHVTDRNVVIAELRATTVPSGDQHRWLSQLESEGAVTMGRGEFEDFKPIRIKGTHISREILEDRR